jgi:pimeloyl-CoA synthetase
MANIKIGISDDAKTFVEKTAIRQGTSEAEVVRSALEAYRFLEDVAETDGAVILERKDGKRERLVRF